MKNLKPKEKKQIHAYNTKVKSQQKKKMKYRKDKCCKTDYDYSLFQILTLE